MNTEYVAPDVSETEVINEVSTEVVTETVTEEIVEETTEELSLESSTESGNDSTTVSGNELVDSLLRSNAEILGMLSSREETESVSDNTALPLYEDYESFVSSPVTVDRYQYEILSRLEFIQYALLIVIALLFLSLFRKK